MTSTIRRFAAAAAATLPLAIPPLLAVPAHADETASPGNDAAKVAALTQSGVVYETITYTAYAWSDYNQELIDDEAFSVTVTCTGFVVNPDGWIATAGHCVDPGIGREHVRDVATDWALDNYYSAGVTFEDARSDVTLYIFDRNDEARRNRVHRAVHVTLPAAVTGGEAEQDLPARVIDWQTFDHGDGALVKVEASDLHALPLSSEDPQIGDPITSVGYPGIIESYTDHDLVPTFQPGSISSQKTVGGGLLPVHQLSQNLEGGVSGGPTVNADGEVIGVISAGFDGTDLTYASPIARIEELLAAAGVEASTSELTSTYREGIAALHDGDRETAVPALSEVVHAQPGNDLAADQLALAEQLPAAEPPARDRESSTVAVLVVVGVTVLLLVVIAITAVAVHRRQAAGRRPVSPYGGYPYGAPAAAYGAGQQQAWAPAAPGA
ncbi:trypsin-like peptidase domain-containing protein, partial [Nocardioides sp.]